MEVTAMQFAISLSLVACVSTVVLVHQFISGAMRSDEPSDSPAEAA